MEQLSSHIDEEIVTLLDMSRSRLIFRNDSHLYHNLSSKFCATDAFLQTYLGVLLHPSTNSVASFLQGLKDLCGGVAEVLPQSTGGNQIVL